MVRSVFGSNASALGRIRDICCAVDCRQSSVTTIATLTLCWQHAQQAYEQLNRFMQNDRRINVVAVECSDEQQTIPAFVGEPWTEQWMMWFEPIKYPLGICPKCNLIGLSRYRQTGVVYCAHRGCDYEATRIEFVALRNSRIKALEDQARCEVVYYVRFGDQVKIGTTVNLGKRLKNLPHDEVMATEPGAGRLERQRHKQFGHLRVQKGSHREWFQLTPELAEHIAAVRARQDATA
jgi:hypothetical protein